MFSSISGRSVLVTGGTKGIGKGIAAAFAAQGAQVAITGRHAGLGEETAAEMTPAELDEVLSINLKGTFYVVQSALPALAASGHGRVIVTSSITGPVTGFSGWTAYGASKAGQLGFLKSAALELAKQKITVNAIMPGNIATEGLADMGAEYIAGMEAAIPLGHLGSVADIAAAALFFASDEAGYITGQTLVVDGGQIIPESLEAMG